MKRPVPVMMRYLLVAGILALSILGTNAPALAQNALRIAAIVNDDIITVRDLDERVRMVIVASNLPRTAQTYQRVWPQVLRSLIDERLKLQEAERLSIVVTEADIEQAKRTMEQRNKLAPGSFDRSLRNDGISPDTVIEQMRADIAWAKLVRRRFQSTVEVTIDEIDDALDRLERNKGAPQYRIREIVLNIDDPAVDEEELAKRLVQQLRSGAQFDAIAREFSTGATAATGGDIGWTTREQLGDEVAARVDEMEPGDISEPIRTIFGYQVIQLTDRRILSGPDPLKAKVTLKQVFLPIPPNSGADAEASQRSIALAVSETAQSCDDMDVLATELDSPAGTDLGTVQVGELSPTLREAVAGLKEGELTKPIRLPSGFSTIMICQREEPESDLPGRDEIANRLRAIKFETFAQRYLRDIRRDAFIDTRI
ncbi:peptidylprolyl isomerase [Nisaea acidiphila]|uniref:Parvulin-like PPIase n=1 Tax=Nisaea acidiphila TaxID=1862145 RepID=A0A9J7AUE7_9PROT|nr:peptidylprolyl isomerase [Nisaea acidiphila]UUX50951.1 peptidylprolyl isomerase [Nisaea acidiphila]